MEISSFPVISAYDCAVAVGLYSGEVVMVDAIAVIYNLEEEEVALMFF